MLNSILTKIILRLLLLRKRYIYRAENHKGHVLFTYTRIPSPRFGLLFFYRKLHNRYYMSKLMVETLNAMGYTVHLYDYLEDTIDYSVNYKIFIGHNRNFASISSKLNSQCRKVLLTTGCSPKFDNEQLAKRNIELKNRIGVSEDFYKPLPETSFAEENCKVADFIFMIGSDFIRENGWYIQAVPKAHLYNNVNLFSPVIKKNQSGGFIYMSSNGQLRRGLDLLLDVFSKRKEKLFICGPFESEELFVKYFKKELFQTSNIIPVGYVNQNSDHFRNMVGNADFAILPSCSEGQSGSLLTLMSYGLLPIASVNTGFDHLTEFGIQIGGFEPRHIQDALDEVKTWSAADIDARRKRMYHYLQDNFTAQAFRERFEKFVNTVEQ